MKQIKCTYCGGEHYQTFCYKKPKPAIQKSPKGGILPLAKRVGKTQAAHAETRSKWIQQNPPDYRGYWKCYLRISPMCSHLLDVYTLTIEHITPKVRGKAYAHDLNNLKPACAPCNGLKGSRTLESLAKEFPHLDQNPDIARLKRE